MQLSSRFYLSTLKYMIMEELVSFKKVFFDHIINLGIWLICSLFVFNYLLVPEFGMPDTFASFMLAGCITTAGIFDSYPMIFRFVSDFEGERTIDYYLTLPIPSWLTIAKLMIYVALRACIFSLLVLPLGVLIIWSQFDSTLISWYQFILIVLASSAFYGAFALFVTSFIKDMSMLDHVWIRFVFPLWFLGGFQHSWATIHKVSPALSYFALLNPITYSMEATRAALLGQDGYLNFWLCLGVLAVFTLACMWYAFRGLQKRLDYV